MSTLDSSNRNMAVIPEATTNEPIKYTGNWEEKTKLDGNKYYYNTVTRQAQNSKPEGITILEQETNSTDSTSADETPSDNTPSDNTPSDNSENIDDTKKITERGTATKFRIMSVVFAFISIMGDAVLGLLEAAKEIHDNVDPENTFGIVGTEAKDKIRDLTKGVVNVTDNAHEQHKTFSDKARTAIPPATGATHGGAKRGENEEPNKKPCATATTFPTAPTKEKMQETLEKTKQGASDALKKGEEIAMTVMKSILLLYENGIGYAMQYGLGLFGVSNILDVPYLDLNTNFNNELTTLSTFLNDAATNPESREAIKELAKAMAVTAVTVIDDVKPEVMHVTDTAVNMFENIAEKGTRGATATMISVLQSFLAEIPWVGGVIDIMIAVGKGFNTAAQVFKIFVSRNAEMTVSTAKGVKKTESAIEQGSERIANAVNKIKNMKNQEESKDTATSSSTNTNTLTVGGGGKHKNKNRNRSRKTKKKMTRMMSDLHTRIRSRKSRG